MNPYRHLTNLWSLGAVFAKTDPGVLLPADNCKNRLEIRIQSDHDAVISLSSLYDFHVACGSHADPGHVHRIKCLGTEQISAGSR